MWHRFSVLIEEWWSLNELVIYYKQFQGLGKLMLRCIASRRKWFSVHIQKSLKIRGEYYLLDKSVDTVCLTHYQWPKSRDSKICSNFIVSYFICSSNFIILYFIVLHFIVNQHWHIGTGSASYGCILHCSGLSKGCNVDRAKNSDFCFKLQNAKEIQIWNAYKFCYLAPCVLLQKSAGNK